MQTWWMLAVRGGLGILLGLVVLLSRVEVGELVVLFGSYAFLDGIWAVGWAVRASRRPLEGWPVVLEGALSMAVGIRGRRDSRRLREPVTFTVGRRRSAMRRHLAGGAQ